MGRKERVRVCHPSGGPMLTKQSEKDLTDVNLIMDSWIHAGAAVAGHLNPAKGSYGDFSSGIDYHTALDAVLEAQTSFAALEPRVRGHVDNDPGKYLDLVFDPERKEECVELGIFPPVKKEVDLTDEGISAELKKIREAFKVPPDKPDVPAETGGGKSVDAAAGLFD